MGHHYTTIELDGHDLTIGVKEDPEDTTVSIGFRSDTGEMVALVELEDVPRIIGALEKAVEGRLPGR